MFSRDPLHLQLGAAENREPELLEEPEIGIRMIVAQSAIAIALDLIGHDIRLEENRCLIILVNSNLASDRFR